MRGLCYQVCRGVGGFCYRLFFTRDDDLDVLQLLFIAAVAFFGLAFWMAGSGKWLISSAAWTTFGAVFATLAIAGTPRWVAQILSGATLPGSVATAIATAKAPEYGATTHAFDVDTVLPPPTK